MLQNTPCLSMPVIKEFFNDRLAFARGLKDNIPLGEPFNYAISGMVS